MSDASKRDPAALGLFGRKGPGRLGVLGGAEVVALALTALWILGVGVFYAAAGDPAPEQPVDPLRGLTVAVAIFMPVALIWIAALAVGSARAVRAETERLQIALDAMRQAYVAQSQAGASGGSSRSSVERKLDEIAAAQKQTGRQLAEFASIRAGGGEVAARPLNPAPKPPEEQPSFDLPSRGNPPVESVGIDDFITALNFPETAEDTAGFRALRRAMQDRRAAELIHASQDILTLLSQEGIYMDDLIPDRAKPEIWRRFAQGERGKTVSGLGGVHDRSSIALTSARMKRDPIFRDTAHHFLRKFDHLFAEFEQVASDGEIAALGETRTARAFMLLGRVAGTFD